MATVDLDDAVATEPRTLRRRMSEEQFVAWASRTERRAEWVDGEVQLMNAIELGHLEYTDFLKELLRRFVREHGLGRILGEPYQIRFPRARRRRQPDIYFVPSLNVPHLERMQFNGVPEVIIEVVSPGSQTVDRRTKFNEYLKAGVPEYWLPDPVLRTFEAYTLGPNGQYERLPEVDGKVYSKVLTGVFFRPSWLRKLTAPDPDPLLAEMSAERSRLLSSSPPPSSDKPSG